MSIKTPKKVYLLIIPFIFLVLVPTKFYIDKPSTCVSKAECSSDFAVKIPLLAKEFYRNGRRAALPEEREYNSKNLIIFWALLIICATYIGAGSKPKRSRAKPNKNRN